MIMEQAKSAVARLTEEEQKEVAFVAVTLDPERDDPEALKRMADGQKVAAPRYHFLTGDSAEVNALLDRMGIERKRNEETGVIDHNNLFLVIDRQGRIAYRFSLGDLQEDWLVEAMRILCAEGDGKAAP